MVRFKYSLSKEGMDKLMDRLEAIAKSEMEEAEGLQEAQVTTNFVKLMTKVKDLQDVIDRNDTLSKTYAGFLSLYGFESMYDMYLYAMSCDLVPEHITKRKDYSKLVPVKRKVVRNGKEVEVTVYEDHNKGEKDRKESDKEGKPTKNPVREEEPVIRARDLTATIVNDKESMNTQNVAKLKQTSTNLKRGNKPFNDNSQMFLTIKDDQGNIAGIVGYSEVDGYLTMDFYRSNGKVAGVASRGFFELIKLAVKEGKGIRMEDNPQARTVFMQSGLEQSKEGYWFIEKEDLASLFEMEETL